MNVVNSMNNINAESIIFDLDGTLWDSADNVSESWDIVVKKLEANTVKLASL